MKLGKALKLIFVGAACCAAVGAGLSLSACDKVATDNSDKTHTEHVFNKKVAQSNHLASAATCTEKAIYYFSCECGESGTTMFEYGEPNGHTEVEFGVKAPTCTEKGMAAGKKCSVCGLVTIQQTEIPALGHDIQNHEGQEATCTQKGWNAYQTCSRCDYNTKVETPLKQHTFTQEKAEKEYLKSAATCTEKAVYYHSCKDCGAQGTTTFEYGEPQHTEVTIVAVEPTCTEKGKTAGAKCLVCGTVTVERTEIPALGHDIQNHEGQEATCTQKGWNAYQTCSRCDYNTKVETPLKQHTFTQEKAEKEYLKSAATCTEKAVYYHSCKDCDAQGTTTFEYGEPKGHTEVDIAAVEPTCTEKGKTAGKKCSVCGTVTVEQTEIPANGHTEVDIAAVEPTCTEKGKTAGKKCSVCGTVTVEQTEIPANGHTEVDIAAVEPTCTEKGKTAGKKCSVCGTVTVEQTEIPANGHTEVDIAAVEPTCTEKGKTAGKKCSVCGTVTVQQTEIPAKGHDFSNGDCACGEKNPDTSVDEDGVIAVTAYDHKQDSQRITHRVQKLFKVNDKFNSDNLIVTATIKNGENQSVSTVTDYEIIKPDMSSAGVKTVTIKYGGKQTNYTITVLDLSNVEKNKAVVTVNASATAGVSGNNVTVKTVNDAVTVFKVLGTDDDSEKLINVSAGTYNEKVEFDIPNLHVKGASSDALQTVIEFNLMSAYIIPGGSKNSDKNKNEEYSTDGAASVSIREAAMGFHAEDITFQNYWNTHERYLQSVEIAKADGLSGHTMAVACLVQADKCVFENVRFSSYHDTLYDINGRHVYKNCYIEGRTDYIFGYGATSLFDNCTLFTIGANDSKNGGYVCATMGYSKYTPQGTTPTTKIDYGYIFKGCTFTSDSRVVKGTVSLARAWSSYMTLAFIECDMSSAYSKTAYGTKENGKNERYGEMSTGQPDAARLYEYANTGEGALDYNALGTGKTDKLCTVLTKAQRDEFVDPAVIFAAQNGQITYSSAWNGEAGVKLPTVYNFGTLPDKSNTTYTSSSPATPFGENAVSIVGSFRQQAGTGIQITVGSVITLHISGKVTIDWYGGEYGTEANGKITYENGCAKIEIIQDSVAKGIYIKSITVDTTQTPSGETDVKLPMTYNFGTLPDKQNTAYTSSSPATPFGEDAVSIVGSFRQQAGTGIQITVGSVITLHVEGKVTIDWYGGSYGTEANGKITYENGCAKIEIIDDSASTGGIYIKSITVDPSQTPN